MNNLKLVIKTKNGQTIADTTVPLEEGKDVLVGVLLDIDLYMASAVVKLGELPWEYKP